MDQNYDKPEPPREDVDRWPGPALLEFGAGWCPHCQAAQPAIAAALADYPNVRHLKVGDGKGKPLGRSFRVKLWPTLIYLRDGQELARVVRPTAEEEVRPGLEAIAGG
jgi:thioredoxin 1